MKLETHQIKSYHSIVGKYEWYEVEPTIDVVKKLAEVLDITVGYLLGETEDRELLKDPCAAERCSVEHKKSPMLVLQSIGLN
jgi:ribosome-binding protein aMBF1 (putative translation factor)